MSDVAATPEDVRAAYRLILGREPDSAETDSHRLLLSRRSITTRQLCAAFLNSQEFSADRTSLEARLEAGLKADIGEAPALTDRCEILASMLSKINSYEALTGSPPAPEHPPAQSASSRLCRQADMCGDGFRYWMNRMNWPMLMHRKSWEWYFIADALWQNGMLQPGKRGLGFGVGREPLTGLFASFGCEVVATDMNPEKAREIGWNASGQHAADVESLDIWRIASAELLRGRVTYREVDMNAIPDDLTNFDFCWSACSLEHIGSLQHGADFVSRAMHCLRPNGVAVHTTEYNLSSNQETLELPHLNLYRRSDIEALADRLTQEGHSVSPVADWTRGCGFADGYVDVPPYSSWVHLRLKLATFDATSMGIIVKAAN